MRSRGLSGRRCGLVISWRCGGTGASLGAAGSVGGERRSAADRPRSGTPTAPGVGQGADSVTLLAQSPWVRIARTSTCAYRSPAMTPLTNNSRSMVYNRLTTRTGFDEAMSGQVARVPDVHVERWTCRPSRADPAGGVDIDIPVNEAVDQSGIPTFYAAAGSGVFPVQIGLLQLAAWPRVSLLSTFLVYAEPPSVSGSPQAFGVAHPAGPRRPGGDGARPVGALPAQQSASLAGLVDALAAYPALKLSLAVTPQTLDALAAPSASQLDRSTLAALVQLVHEGNIQVVPKTYVAVPLRGWSAAGLGSELTTQLNPASSVLAGAFGTAPVPDHLGDQRLAR